MRADLTGSAAEARPAPVATLWAVLGIAVLFAWAIVRLGRRGVLTISGGLAELEWVALVLLTAAFVYLEGYRALDRRWIPAMMRRARDLRFERNTMLRLLAPLHCLSLIGVGRTALLRAWLGTAAIVAAVLVVRSLPEPWRGIVDFAVAAALAWGLAGILRRLPAALER